MFWKFLNTDIFIEPNIPPGYEATTVFWRIKFILLKFILDYFHFPIFK